MNPFEKRIKKEKLPKGFSYVVQTSDITKTLDVNLLDLFYSNCQFPIKLPKIANWWHETLNLLEYHEYVLLYGFCADPDRDYNRGMKVYSVYGPVRKKIRNVLVEEVLPYLRSIQGKYNGHKLSVYYQTFHKSNATTLDWGGIYIEMDKYDKKEKVLYRNKDFNIDEELKLCLK